MFSVVDVACLFVFCVFFFVCVCVDVVVVVVLWVFFVVVFLFVSTVLMFEAAPGDKDEVPRK